MGNTRDYLDDVYLHFLKYLYYAVNIPRACYYVASNALQEPEESDTLAMVQTHWNKHARKNVLPRSMKQRLSHMGDSPT